MMERTIAIVLLLIVVAVVLVWRDERSQRWSNAGLCYKCGCALDSDAPTIRVKWAADLIRDVQVCSSCKGLRTSRNMVFGIISIAAIILFFYIATRR